MNRDCARLDEERDPKRRVLAKRQRRVGTERFTLDGDVEPEVGARVARQDLDAEHERPERAPARGRLVEPEEATL